MAVCEQNNLKIINDFYQPRNINKFIWITLPQNYLKQIMRLLDKTLE